jgi:hypothetical protein
LADFVLVPGGSTTLFAPASIAPVVDFGVATGAPHKEIRKLASLAFVEV